MRRRRLGAVVAFLVVIGLLTGMLWIPFAEFVLEPTLARISRPLYVRYLVRSAAWRTHISWHDGRSSRNIYPLVELGETDALYEIMTTCDNAQVRLQAAYYLYAELGRDVGRVYLLRAATSSRQESERARALYGLGLGGDWRTAIPGLIELAEADYPVEPSDLARIAHKNSLFYAPGYHVGAFDDFGRDWAKWRHWYQVLDAASRHDWGQPHERGLPPS